MPGLTPDLDDTTTGTLAAPVTRHAASLPGRTRIRAIGTAVPAHGYTQARLATFMKRVLAADSRLSRRLDVLYTRSGIERRHSCVPDFGLPPERFTFLPRDWRAEPGAPTSRRMEIYQREAPRLATLAVERALASTGAAGVGRITDLIVVSCTGFAAPGLDHQLLRRFDLKPSVARTMIGFQGCHAGISGLRTADAVCRADHDARVLLVCVELCSLHFQTGTREDDLLANALFADGAAAVVLEAGSIEAPGLAIRRFASWIEPGTGEEMSWSVGDHGFVMRLSPRVPRLLGSRVRDFLARGLGLGETFPDFWAIHPGGPAILDQVELALSLDPEALVPSRKTLARCGNMSSPTLFFVLEDARRALADREHHRSRSGVALAFGPGLTIEGALLEYGDG